jgi:hypothetical protein
MQYNQGYIALVTVLIISGVALAIAATVSLLGIGVEQSALTGSKGESTLELTEGCAEDALLKSQLSSSYNGGNITRPEGTCVITVTKNVNNWTIKVTSTQTDYNRTVQINIIRIPSSPITISSWQEVPSGSTPTSAPTATPTPTPTPTPTMTPTPTPGGTYTAGYTTTNGSFDSGNNSMISSTQVTSGANSGPIQSISVYIGTVDVSPSNHMQVGIYADSSNAPGSRLASSGSVTLVANSWNTVPISGVTINANTKYWLGFNVDGAGTTYGWSSTTSGLSDWQNATFGTWPNPFGSPSFTSSSNAYAIYMTY